jgi:hypothetical protein
MDFSSFPICNLNWKPIPLDPEGLGKNTGTRAYWVGAVSLRGEWHPRVVGYSSIRKRVVNALAEWSSQAERLGRKGNALAIGAASAAQVVRVSLEEAREIAGTRRL